MIKNPLHFWAAILDGLIGAILTTLFVWFLTLAIVFACSVRW